MVRPLVVYVHRYRLRKISLLEASLYLELFCSSFICVMKAAMRGFGQFNRLKAENGKQTEWYSDAAHDLCPQPQEETSPAASPSLILL